MSTSAEAQASPVASRERAPEVSSTRRRSPSSTRKKGKTPGRRGTGTSKPRASRRAPRPRGGPPRIAASFSTARRKKSPAAARAASPERVQHQQWLSADEVEQRLDEGIAVGARPARSGRRSARGSRGLREPARPAGRTRAPPSRAAAAGFLRRGAGWSDRPRPARGSRVPPVRAARSLRPPRGRGHRSAPRKPAPPGFRAPSARGPGGSCRGPSPA